MTISEADHLLTENLGPLNATSFTLYVSDPYWPDEYRLISMPGVTVKEPMYGFVSPPKSRAVVCEGAHEVFRENVSAEHGSQSQNRQSQISISTNSELFNDFGMREKIGAYARFFLPAQDRPPGVLFANFSKETRFDDSLKAALRELALNLSSVILDLKAELRKRDAGSLEEVVKILRPSHSLVRASGVSFLAEQFHDLLKVCMDALGMDPACDTGTIHIFNRSKSSLELFACHGAIQHRERAQSHDVASGDGIVSWVAIQERAILIQDLASSPFKAIHVAVNDNIQSEVAVPMIAHGELLGVLNLEARQSGKFSPASVRSLSCAASNAAMVFHSARSFDLTRSLLQTAVEATEAEKNSPVKALSKIADVLRSSSGADFCDVWHYNSQLSRFDSTSAGYGAQDSEIRQDGWSYFLQRHKKPIWISDVRSANKFRAQRWDGSSWKDSLAPYSPESVNSKLTELHQVAELGLPILVGQACVGVAWLKFLRPVPPPSEELMTELIMMTSHAGLVLELIARQQDRMPQYTLESIGEKLKPWLASGRLDFSPLTFLDGYVGHNSVHAHVGGDFHVLKHVDNATVTLVIGDGEGHAVPGLVNALPLISTCELLGGESGSARHGMEKLIRVAGKLGLGGTAIYTTFTLIDGAVYLSVTSAAHPPMIRIPSQLQGNHRTLPPDTSSWAHGRPLGTRLTLPMAEHQEALRTGDLLILYTDGISDAFGTFYASRMALLIQELVGSANSELTCEDLVNYLLAEATKASSQKALGDDATVCVLKVLDPKNRHELPRDG